MSAYGSIAPKSSSQLLATTWRHPNASQQHVIIHHLTLKAAQELPGLIDHLGATFIQEIEDGLTYPQEVMSPELFTAYFFAADVLVAIVADGSVAKDGEETSATVEATVQGRSWDECVVGYYYVSHMKHTCTSKR
jgi:hypothetical protein